MADKVPKLGGLIEGPETRDAIHIAVAPVIADERLLPGQRVKLANSRDNEHVVPTMLNPVGIIDPYLVGPVEEGQKCWMMLMPNTVTGLRHDWNHPQFSNSDERAKAESFLRFWAISLGENYEELMQGMLRMVLNEDYYTLGTTETEIPNMVWDRFEMVTGTSVSKEQRKDLSFNCSC